MGPIDFFSKPKLRRCGNDMIMCYVCDRWVCCGGGWGTSYGKWQPSPCRPANSLCYFWPVGLCWASKWHATRCRGYRPAVWWGCCQWCSDGEWSRHSSSSNCRSRGQQQWPSITKVCFHYCKCSSSPLIPQPHPFNGLFIWQPGETSTVKVKCSGI